MLRSVDGLALRQLRTRRLRSALTALAVTLGVGMMLGVLLLSSTAELREDVDREISQQFDMFNAIVAVAVLASLLGVINTLAMSVLERTREIGVLRALGASRMQVRATMVCEALLLTLAGALVGLGFGLPIAFLWSRGLGDLLPGATFAVPLGTLAVIAVAAVVLGALAAILPARRAARMDVATALAAE